MGSRPDLTAEEKLKIRLLIAAGQTITAVAAEVDRHPSSVDNVISAAGGIRPRQRKRRAGALSLDEREEISRALSRGCSFAAIGRDLDRCTSTISREVNANGGRQHYRAWAAENRAARRACRPKVAKLKANPALRRAVVRCLKRNWSPEQIARHLKGEHPDDPEMQVSHETIYQSLYVQGRGALRKELTTCLRTGRARRRNQGRSADRRGRIADMVLISERPAEVEDRAVPGHWEGDLIKGKANHSAIVTLVERSTRYVMLGRIQSQRAEDVNAVLVRLIRRLPVQLRRSLTWDQGTELAGHLAFSVATGVDVYFCDPHAPWQRGSNENTNGLLRQYFPKSTDLSVHSQQKLDAVARELNGRPRQTLGWMSPSQKFAELVALTA